MYDPHRKQGPDFFYWLIILGLLATTAYFLDFHKWSAISKSDFPLSSHITSRLAYVWHVFWPIIISAVAYPFVKAAIIHSKWERSVLIPWKLFTLILFGILWWAMFYGT